jgi:hypothetical protein
VTEDPKGPEAGQAAPIPDQKGQELPKYKLTLDTLTASYMLDVYRGGEKQGSFVSYTVRADPPIPLEDEPWVRLDLSLSVARATILDALTRGSISKEDADERISNLKSNVGALRESFLRKRFLDAQGLKLVPIEPPPAEISELPGPPPEDPGPG